MTSLMILQLITTISMYCSQANDLQYSKRSCFKKIWICGHKVTESIAIVTETHNCITKHVKDEI